MLYGIPEDCNFIEPTRHRLSYRFGNELKRSYLGVRNLQVNRKKFRKPKQHRKKQISERGAKKQWQQIRIDY